MIKSSYTAANAFPAKLLHCQSVKDNKILPLHIQLCPTNLCNLNCNFCSCADRDKTKTLKYGTIKDVMLTYKDIGTRAVTITGGGEPLLHPQINEIIKFISLIGIKIGLVTNGTQFQKLTDKNISRLTWCRISISDDRKLELNKIPVYIPIDWAFSYVATRTIDFKNIATIVNFANRNNFTHIRIVSDILDIETAGNMDKIHDFLAKQNISDKLVIYQNRQSWTSGTKKCLISLLKPAIAVDGLIYPCCGVQYARNDISRDFEKIMSMGTINNIQKIYENQEHFNGEKCVRCYYSDYNQALSLLTQKLSHIDFV